MKCSRQRITQTANIVINQDHWPGWTPIEDRGRKKWNLFVRRRAGKERKRIPLVEHYPDWLDYRHKKCRMRWRNEDGYNERERDEERSWGLRADHLSVANVSVSASLSFSVLVPAWHGVTTRARKLLINLSREADAACHDNRRANGQREDFARINNRTRRTLL